MWPLAAKSNPAAACSLGIDGDTNTDSDADGYYSSDSSTIGYSHTNSDAKADRGTHVDSDALAYIYSRSSSAVGLILS